MFYYSLEKKYALAKGKKQKNKKNWNKDKVRRKEKRAKLKNKNRPMQRKNLYSFVVCVYSITLFHLISVSLLHFIAKKLFFVFIDRSLALTKR